MFTIKTSDSSTFHSSRESAEEFLDSIDIDGMEATRDAIDDGKTEYWSEIAEFVTIECTIPWDERV